MNCYPLTILAMLALVLAVSAQSIRAQGNGEFSFRSVRQAHKTKLSYAPETPPKGVFDLIKYRAPLGEMSAYVTPDPGDGKKHPLILWLVGGFSNSIEGSCWKDADPSNDQTAAAYRKAGLLMMFPSLRGGNDNPGKVEVCFGEVDDVIAAAKHAATLPYVDPTRIYLGGHSTGGTLALLVAGTTDMFRAVISFGPAYSVGAYGAKNLPFDSEDRSELIVRAPIACLSEIKSTTFVLEGAEGGNVEALTQMRTFTKNPSLHFYEVAGASHFSILAPFNRLFAKKLLADSGEECEIELSSEEVNTTAREVKADP